MKKVLIFSGLCGVGLLVLMFAMSSQQKVQATETASDDQEVTETKEEEKETVYSVDVAKVAPRKLLTYVESTATLSADRSVEIFSKVAGQVDGLPVEEGDEVEKGDVLLSLDGDDERLKLEESKVQLDRAQAEYNRIEKSYRNQLVSTDEFEAKKFDLDKAKATHDLAKYNYQQNQIVAPFNGTIVERNVEVGQTIQPSEKLFLLSALNPLEADVFLPEGQTNGLKRGMDVELSGRDSFEQAFEGKISRISPVVDRETGTVKVTVSVFDAPGGVRPGTYVHLRIITSENVEDTVIPKRSLIFDNRQNAYVYTLKEAGDAENTFRVARTSVELGIEDGDYVQVLKGLDASNQIVLTGKESLKDGALVKNVGANQELAAN